MSISSLVASPILQRIICTTLGLSPRTVSFRLDEGESGAMVAEQPGNLTPEVRVQRSSASQRLRDTHQSTSDDVGTVANVCGWTKR